MRTLLALLLFSYIFVTTPLPLAITRPPTALSIRAALLAHGGGDYRPLARWTPAVSVDVKEGHSDRQPAHPPADPVPLASVSPLPPPWRVSSAGRGWRR